MWSGGMFYWWLFVIFIAWTGRAFLGESNSGKRKEIKVVKSIEVTGYLIIGKRDNNSVPGNNSQLILN